MRQASCNGRVSDGAGRVRGMAVGWEEFEGEGGGTVVEGNFIIGIPALPSEGAGTGIGGLLSPRRTLHRAAQILAGHSLRSYS